MIYGCELVCPWGQITLLSNGSALTGLYTRESKAVDVEQWEEVDPFPAARIQLERYFAGELREFNLPLAPQGTAFQVKVWKALEEIPYGTTVSYGELARRIGADSAASRAIGLANGRNPIAIIIPCHRVIGANGGLTGYAGGLEMKRALLELEGALTAQDQLPLFSVQ